jgi:16S rRNA (guanine527-N7)-methyltransferase
MNIMNQNLLVNNAKALGIELSTQQIGKFQEYFNLLNKWGKSINLTAIKNPDEIVLKHFLDSLTLTAHISPKSSLIDIGTGAGFPGIPLKIALPDLSVTLVDSTAKKIGFLDLIIRGLKLENCNAVHGRAEDLGKMEQFKNNYNFVTARALASAKDLFPLLIPFAAKQGQILMLKGAEAQKESSELSIDCPAKIEIIPLKIPGLEAQRNLIKISLNSEAS